MFKQRTIIIYIKKSNQETNKQWLIFYIHSTSLININTTTYQIK